MAVQAAATGAGRSAWNTLSDSVIKTESAPKATSARRKPARSPSSSVNKAVNEHSANGRSRMLLCNACRCVLHGAPGSHDVVPGHGEMPNCQPQREATVQNRVRKEGDSGRIDRVEQTAILIVRAAIAKTDKRKRNRSGYFKIGMTLDD